MDLTSLHFLFLFLPLFILFYLVPHKELRLLLITIASLVFLAWGGLNALRWLSLILITAYFVGLSLSSENGKGKAIWLWIGVGINLGLLSFFKLHTAYGPKLLGMNGIPYPLRQAFIFIACHYDCISNRLDRASPPHSELPIQFTLSIPMLALGGNFGFIWALAHLQSGAYKKVKADGYEALEKYEYDVDGALFFGGIVAIVCALVGVLIIPIL